ncbi:hypothetical protein D3C84_756680 [compost metagenome]
MKHLQATGTIDLHHAVTVLRHAGNQLSQKLINDPLAFFRAVKNEQRREIAFQPEQGLLGLRRHRRGQRDDQEQARQRGQAPPVRQQAGLDESRKQTLELRWLRLCAVV